LSRERHELGPNSTKECARKPHGKSEVYGWLDRRRRVLEILEEAIENAREESQAKTGRGRDNASRLEWTKTLHRLLETYGSELESIKHHIWGNPSLGNVDEPGEALNGLVEFERSFQRGVLDPWDREDLQLECEDCGRSSEEVTNRSFPSEWIDGKYTEGEDVDLCDECYQKRITAKMAKKT